MNKRTKIGLILIALAWLTASSAVSAHFVAKAQNESGIHDRFTEPARACGAVPANVRSQGGLWV